MLSFTSAVPRTSLTGHLASCLACSLVRFFHIRRSQTNLFLQLQQSALSSGSASPARCESAKMHRPSRRRPHPAPTRFWCVASFSDSCATSNTAMSQYSKHPHPLQGPGAVHFCIVTSKGRRKRIWCRPYSPLIVSCRMQADRGLNLGAWNWAHVSSMALRNFRSAVRGVISSLPARGSSAQRTFTAPLRSEGRSAFTRPITTTTVSAGLHHTCAIKTDGQLVCFGGNSSGQCTVPSGLGPVLAVSAGCCHTCAVRADGRLVCFGRNSEGQCNVPERMGPVAAVSAGCYHTCVAGTDGQLVCFGENHDGECEVPTDLGPVHSMSAGMCRTCATGADGRLFCFGETPRGQCHVPGDLGPIRDVSLGAGHTCAVTADGSLVCFGLNNYGQCATPRDLGMAVATSVGKYHSCVLSADGKLFCFGDNFEGQCDVPSDLDSFLAMSTGLRHTCAVAMDGQLVCFGENYRGQCNVPSGLGPVLTM